MENIYREIENRVRNSGFNRNVSGEDIYGDICDQIEDKEDGAYILLSKFDDDVTFEYSLQIMDENFNLSSITITAPEGKFFVDFD